jgi:heptosyltransferase-2
MRARLGVIGALRAERFDACLAYFPSNRWEYHLLPFLAGVKQRFAFRYHLGRWRSLSFLANRHVAVDPSLHDVRQNRAMSAAFLGSPRELPEPVFPKLYGEEERAWAARYVDERAGGKRLVGIHAGSSADHGMDSKRWPARRFGSLAGKLCGKLDARALVFGGPEERELKNEVIAAMQPGQGIAADTPSLRHTCALIDRCAICVCNDSGLMHISACLGVPTVGIFGPTDERRNGPVGRATLVVRKHLDGFPLWTAVNVGRRSAPRGVDPRASLMALSAEEAWERIDPWLAALA